MALMKIKKKFEDTQWIKHFNYDNVSKIMNLKNNIFLLQIKFKALTMEENDANLWWDALHDIVKKDIGQVYKRYERNERLYMYRISQMEKVIPSSQYELLVVIPKLETSYEKKEGNIDGVGPLGIRT